MSADQSEDSHSVTETQQEDFYDIDIDIDILEYGNKELMVLTSVAEIQEDEGYASGKDVNEYLMNKLDTDWSSGKLYPVLNELHEEGYLEKTETVRRKDYTLTEEGFEHLGEKIDNLLETAHTFGQIYAEFQGKPDELDAVQKLINED